MVGSGWLPCVVCTSRSFLDLAEWELNSPPEVSEDEQESNDEDYLRLRCSSSARHPSAAIDLELTETGVKHAQRAHYKAVEAALLHRVRSREAENARLDTRNKELMKEVCACA